MDMVELWGFSLQPPPSMAAFSEITGPPLAEGQPLDPTRRCKPRTWCVLTIAPPRGEVFNYMTTQRLMQ